MPVVYGTPKVSPQGMGAPEINVNTAGTHGEAIGQGLQSVSSGVMALHQVAKERANDTYTNSVYEQVGMWKIKNIDDPKNPKAAKSRKGENYINDPEATNGYIQQFDEWAKEIAKQAITPDQKAIFEKIYRQSKQQILEDLVGWEYKQAEVVAKNKYDGAVDIAVTQGAAHSDANPNKIEEFKRQLEDIIERRAKSEGWSKEQKEAESLVHKTRFHKGVIEKMKEEDPLSAEVYLEAYKDEIAPDVRDELTKAVAGASLMARARSEASKIQLAAGPKNYTEQYAQAKKLLDEGKMRPDVYDEVTKWLSRDESHEVAARNREDEDRLGTMLNMIEGRYQAKSGVLYSENEPEFQRLSDTSKAKARARARELMGSEKSAIRTNLAEVARNNREALQEFRNRPLRERANAKIDTEYLNWADDDTRRIMKAMQRDDKVTIERGEEIKYDEFMRQVKAKADQIPSLRDDADLTEKFISDMILWRADWRSKNEYKDPRQRDFDDKADDWLLFGDSGHILWHPDKFKGQTEEGEDFEPFDEDEQPNAGSRRLLRPGQAPSAEKPDAKSQKKPLAVKPGYTAIRNKKKPDEPPMQSPSGEALDKWLSSHPDWEKVQ